MELRVIDGFDGGWIVVEGTDGKAHLVGTAFEPGAIAARAALPRVRAELETWGIERWCATYGVDPSVVFDSP